MKVPSDCLDEESLRYLQAVEAGSGQGCDGVFVRRRVHWSAGPRGGWAVYALAGLLLLGAAAGFCWPPVFAQMAGTTRVGVQSALTAAGAFLLLLGAARYRRSAGPLHASFLYADALHLWDVQPDSVEAIDLTQLHNVDGRHRYENGAYVFSILYLTLGDKYREVTLSDQAGAERLLRYLAVLQEWRNSASGDVRLMAATSPGRLGALAARVAADGPDTDLSCLPEGPAPPRPEPLPPAEWPRRPGVGGVLVRLTVAALLGTAGLFAFAPLNRLVLDEYLFARIRSDDDLGSMDRYLAAFPAGGRHTANVVERRDDGMFLRGKNNVASHDSPLVLREYLADARNQKHRGEARQLIATFYDRTVADLRARAAANKGKMDHELFAAVLALLQGLKQADVPVVTVGFTGKIDAEPVTEDQKQLERLVYRKRVEDKPELARIAEGRPDKSAILPRGAVFDPEQKARREQLIFERLRAALQKGVSEDVLTLRQAEPGEKAVIEVEYHVYATGGLYLYTFTDPGGKAGVRGLLRNYAVAWTITVRPPGDARPRVWRLASEPATNLNYDSDPSDPDWAVYAVILYSSFYDLSDRLIRGFALAPGPQPNAFTFTAVARHKEGPGGAP